MSQPISRRGLANLVAGAALAAATGRALASNVDDRPKNDAPKPDGPKPDDKPPGDPPKPAAGPIEAPLDRDYTPPDFKPSWKKQQLNRMLVQDFVIYAHSDLEMVKKLLQKEPALINGTMDWGGGDWETGLGGASHMGRRDIVAVLLGHGARVDLFCAAMLGLLDVVKALITHEPKLIDAKGPHGFTLHFHAQVGGKEAESVLDYLQSVKKVELKPNPFLKQSAPATTDKPK